MIPHQIPIIFSPIQINFESTGSLSQAEAVTSFDPVDFAYRLSRFSTFLPAAHELLSVLSESNYTITTRKIIRLLELARNTLERAGIMLYSFASCPEAFVAHKKVYIDLLKVLQANERREKTELQGRIRVLLMPLTSKFSVQKRHSSLHIRSDPLQRHLRITSVSSCLVEGTEIPESSGPFVTQHTSMLPPDAFSAKIRPQSSLPIRDSPIGRPRSPLWDYRQFKKSPTPKRRQDQENTLTQSGKYRPPKRLRQFGIYCTRKSSIDNLNPFRRNERQTFVL